MHSFDLFDLLMLIPPKASVLSYCSIFITHINIHPKKFVDNISCPL